MELRVIRSSAGHPAFNMALDEALLASPVAATLRLYGWDPPGLSLGYFQPLAPFQDTPGEHVVVRRLTGGGAIYHDQELTFCLALDAALAANDVHTSYRTIHDALSRALHAIGVRAHRIPANGAIPSPRPGADWCFRHGGPHDLVDAAGRKILGSAQRRVRKPRPRILHHGSLVLRRPSQTPFCAAVADSVPPEEVLDELCDHIVSELGRVLGLDPVPGHPSDDEISLAASLRANRYEHPDFVARR